MKPHGANEGRTPVLTDAVPIRSHARRSAEAAAATLAGERLVRFRVDGTHRAGALTARDGGTIARAAELALSTRVPLLGVVETSGADLEQGMQSLHGWGTAARALVRCSGIVPVVIVVTGPVASGPALLLGVCDVVIATPDALAWVTGPTAVADVTGVEVDGAALGGVDVLATRNGVVALTAPDEHAAVDLAATVLGLLPAHCDEDPPSFPTDDPVDRPVDGLDAVVPASATGSYDVRTVIEHVVDDGWHVELRSRWASNLVTTLATIGGRPVGIVANQPQAMAGTLDIAASQKGARFVQFCDAFNLPIITLVDTPGFFPGKDLEWRGMIRHGAQLVFAYAEATVPRICVIVRKAYGGAYIVMDCKSMGNDLCLAWPSAEIAVMGAKGAVAILHRSADDETRASLEAEYESAYLNPYVAAERGFVDMVAEPGDTRRLLSRALDVLCTKRERLVPRAHSNTPL